jgi:hypothetical protein
VRSTRNPAIYLINFLFLYMANPHAAANMPAYRAPIPQAVVDCLEQNPTGCPSADFRRFFEEEAVESSDNQNGKCVWRLVCQELPKWERLARQNSDNLNRSTSHRGRSGPTSSLDSWGWTKA